MGQANSQSKSHNDIVEELVSRQLIFSLGQIKRGEASQEQ